MVAATFLLAVAFALVHLYGGRLAVLSRTPRSRWLSFAGGVAVAYVFVHVLPELGEHQERVEVHVEDRGVLAFLDAHVYLLALLGLGAFYGLEHAARLAGRRRQPAADPGDDHAGGGIFAVHVVSYALYNALIGYLLLHREDSGWQSLAFFAVAIGLHFLINDRGLEAHHGRLYRRYGRWVLAAAVLIGWGVGVVWPVHPLVVSALFAVLAGGVILTVLKEELPAERESRFPAFAGGALVYSVLMLAAL